jgi:hypothetical protein
MPKPALAAVTACAFIALAAGCAMPPPDDAPTSPAFALDAEAADAGWDVLFGGDDLDAWRAFGEAELPAGWHLASGALYFDGRLSTPDLITRERYASFELVLEWRAAPGANSGILFHVSEAHAETFESGPEFQILEDEASALHRTGANYALHPAAPHPASTDPDGWNEARVIVHGSEVEHWRNGERIVHYTLGDEDWKRRVAASKFAWMPGYGLESEGHIALQAHANPIWFRHIRIRRLDADSQ